MIFFKKSPRFGGVKEFFDRKVQGLIKLPIGAVELACQQVAVFRKLHYHPAATQK